jgi:hypothetical protein
MKVELEKALRDLAMDISKCRLRIYLKALRTKGKV